MIEFISTNLSTILISLALLIIVSLIIYNEIKKKREGKYSCGANCANCALSKTCHKAGTELQK